MPLGSSEGRDVVNLAIAIPRVLSPLVEPITRRIGITYAEVPPPYPHPVDSTNSEYVQVLQFWIKLCWLILTVEFGLALPVIMLATRYGLGYAWFAQHGDYVSGPFLLMFLFSGAMLLIEFVREAYWKWSPARSYDVLIALAGAVPVFVLSIQQ